MPIPTVSAQALPLTKTVNAGVIYIDVDGAAERVIVFDRMYLHQYWHSKVTPHLKNGKVAVVVPVEYASSNALAAIIFDDDAQYNLAGADRLSADLINIATTTP